MVTISVTALAVMPVAVQEPVPATHDDALGAARTSR
jgi:hypothetical protein